MSNDTDSDDVSTIHRNEGGEQVTERHVEVEDATGQTYTHEFRVEDGTHAYLGEGEPPESALSKLEPFETDE